MAFSSSKNQTTAIGLDRTRRLAIATVCVTAAATFPVGGFLMTIPLVLGVIAQPRSPRRGRWLMWAGAAYLSATLLPMEILLLREVIAGLGAHRLGVLDSIWDSLWIVSVLLIAWCDVALVINAVKTRRSGIVPERCSLGTSDWIVWITALCFSVYSFSQIPFLGRAYKLRFERVDLLLITLAVLLIAVAFDVALAVDAVKMWRTRRTGTGKEIEFGPDSLKEVDSLAHKATMNRRGKWGIVTAALVGCACIAYLLYINRATTRTYQAFVALDGKDPLFTDPPWDGPDAVVLYRTGRNGVVCFDAFHSKDLHDRLSGKNGQLVNVEYDIFGGNFGKVSGYNVHSVDGMILANGSHVLREDFAGSAGVRQKGEGSAGGDDCW